MSTNSKESRYLIFLNGNYIDLHDGRFYDSERNKITTINKPNGMKFTPKELKILTLMIKNKNTLLGIETLDTVLDSSRGNEAANVNKRILEIRYKLSPYCCDVPSAEKIIRVEKNDLVPKLRRYGFFLTEKVVLNYEPVFTTIESVPIENPEKASERKKIDSLADLASSDSKLGRYQEALDKRKMVYSWRRDNLGEDHEETVRAMANLATSYNKLKMYDEALALRKKVLEIREKTCDPSSDLLRKAKKNLAITLSSIGGPENLLEADRIRKEIHEMLSNQ